MKAFVAGATGALGQRVARRLVLAGHEVVGMTRSAGGAAVIRGLGATPVIGDLLDAGFSTQALADTRPDVVFELVNALPKRGPQRFSDLDQTNRLRDEGTRILLHAAIACDATRFVAESVIFSYGYGDLGSEPLTEATPVQQVAPVAAGQRALDAMHLQEQQVLQASAEKKIEGIVLRVGGYYGPVPSMDSYAALLRRRLLPVPKSEGGRLSLIHIDDAANAVVLAAEHGRPGNIYNIVDDEPTSIGDLLDALAAGIGAKRPMRVPPRAMKLGGKYLGLVGQTNLVVDNSKAKRELQWRPSYPTYREGIAAYVATIA